MAMPSSVALKSSDQFNYFYQNILSASSFADFERDLFTFMQQVLKQNTCLLYCNIRHSESPGRHTLQRGSYCVAPLWQIEQGEQKHRWHQAFPTVISLAKESQETQQKPTPAAVSVLPKNPGNWQDWQQGMQEYSLSRNFFSVVEPKPFLQPFQAHAEEHLRCGMLLQDSAELYGALLYEKPLSHPHLSHPFRLHQLQVFLSLALQHRKVIDYASYDQLTKLHRKYHFFDIASKQLQQKNLAHQLLIIDIDFFKKFNDTYGHLKGDECLQTIAQAIKNSIRSQDIAARFGGEEFLCLVQSSIQQASSVAARIHRSIQTIKLKDSEQGMIPAPTVSIGLASLRAGETLHCLVERADQALYRAKQEGRNQTIMASQ